MAARKSPKKTQAAVKMADTVESKVVALAEQLGWLLGTVRGKADGLLANEAVQQEVARIRDSATELMEHVNRAGASASTSAKQMAVSAGKSAKKAVASATEAARKATRASRPVVVAVAKPSRGAVDAPGKRHRKPPPQEKLDRRMGEPVGKQMGQKQFQPGHGARRG